MPRVILSIMPRVALASLVPSIVGSRPRILLCSLFLKYVVFEDPVLARQRTASRRKRREGARKTKRQQQTNAARPSALLAALQYDLASHPKESLDWLNVLIGQVISFYRNLIAGTDTVGLLEEMFNSKTPSESHAPGFIGLDYIQVDAVDVGAKFPVLSDARVRPTKPNSGEESVKIDIDIDYSDQMVISVQTYVNLNFPRPRFAVLPASVTLILEKFSGTFTVLVEENALHVSLDPDFSLEISMSTLLGARSKLQDIPKVEQLILARIRSYIQQKLVLPYGFINIALPNIEKRASPAPVAPTAPITSTPVVSSHLASIEISEGDL